jgi:hypothetical protein
MLIIGFFYSAAKVQKSIRFFWKVLFLEASAVKAMLNICTGLFAATCLPAKAGLFFVPQKKISASIPARLSGGTFFSFY